MLQLEKSIHWKNLQQLALQYRDIHLRELFTREGNRFETYSIELPNLLLDYSKNCLTPEIMQALFGLAEDMGLGAATERMYRGAKINVTEDRAVLHTCSLYTSPSPRD